MNIELSDEAQEYGRLASRAIEGAGGDLLMQRVEENPDERDEIIAPVLAEVGAWELDLRGSADELEAAAALCRAAGRWALPYPVAERLARPADLEADGLVVVPDLKPSAPLAHLGSLRWVAISLSGARSWATPQPLTTTVRKSAFITRLDLDPIDTAGTSADLGLGLTLPCWTLLGMFDRAIEMTCDYVREREQFGQPLAAFQSVQFQLTDAEVERAGIEELAKYALWSVQAGRDDALSDALALRTAAIEAAEVVFRVTHQLHGAIGFCDETTLSWVSRYSQPIRRLPFTLSESRDRLTAQIGRTGISGLFDALAPSGR